MRITTNSQAATYQSNLFQVQERVDNNNQRIATGKDIIRIADAPGRIVDIQQLTTHIERNSQYKKSMQEATGELLTVEASLEAFSSKLSDIRDIVLKGSETSNTDKLPVLANQIQQLLTDMVKEANHDYDGRFTFAGTMTTPASIVPTPPQVTKEPFELIQGAKTSANPSGLQVVFKGNFQDRVINKSATSTEVVNSKADAAFGAGGVEVFEIAIKMINHLQYRADGSSRTTNELFNTAEQRTLQGYTSELFGIIQKVDEEIGRVGGRISRLNALTDQITTENTNLGELRSQSEDTNMPEAILQLKKNENALQYSLQIGARLFGQSLLDFLR
jgi:flagellar hook-associated protein 3 FlgL